MRQKLSKALIMSVNYKVEPTEQNDAAIFVFPVMKYLDRHGRCFKNESARAQPNEFTNRKWFLKKKKNVQRRS